VFLDYLIWRGTHDSISIRRLHFHRFSYLPFYGKACPRKIKPYMMIYLLVEKFSYDLKQLLPLESRVVSEHSSYQEALISAMNVHPWDMNCTEWFVEIEGRKLN
jgi:hypothetical protein